MSVAINKKSRLKSGNFKNLTINNVTQVSDLNQNLMKNKFGYFTDEGREFVITKPTETPRPWLNKLFNNDYYLNCDQFGRSMSQYQDGKGNWSIICMNPGEFSFSGNKGIFVHEKDTEEIWDFGWVFTQKKFDDFKTRVGLGYSIIETSYKNLEMSWRLFVPVKDSVELWTFKIKNSGKTTREISLFPFMQMELTGYNLPPGSGAGRYDSYISADISEDGKSIVSKNQIPCLPMDKYNSVFATDILPDSFESVESSFLGTGQNFAFPKAVINNKLSNSESRGNKLLSAFQFNIKLEPGESFEGNICAGAVSLKNNEQINFPKKYLEKNEVENQFELLETKKMREEFSVFVQTPDEEINYLTNFWVKQQVNWCTHFSRGWGKGYRDTLQDAQAFRFIENSPALADKQFFKYREILNSALTHQYADGRGTRKWSPVNPENYNDAPAWLIFAVIDYLKESGDYDLLNKEVPYFDSGSATVFEHILQAARHMLDDRGKHGLVRMRFGDWNDGITGVGAGGEGESVMTSQMLYGNLKLLEELCDFLKISSDDGFTEKLAQHSEKLYNDINNYAWDGEYYCRAFDDNGNKIGAANCSRGKIYIEPQAFGLSMKIASPEQADLVLKSVEELLEIDYGCPLLFPAYQKFDPAIGRLTGHVPGIWENGGVYCHGTAFFILGLCQYGYGNKVYKLLKKILASNPLNPSEKSGLEPYILTNCFVGPENKTQAGFARLSWETGTASWVFRDILEGMFGITSQYDGLEVKPCLPDDWKEAKLSRWYRNKRFNFTIKQSSENYINLNGKLIVGFFIPIKSCLKENEVEVGVKNYEL